MIMQNIKTNMYSSYNVRTAKTIAINTDVTNISCVDAEVCSGCVFRKYAGCLSTCQEDTLIQLSVIRADENLGGKL